MKVAPISWGVLAVATVGRLSLWAEPGVVDVEFVGITEENQRATGLLSGAGTNRR